MKRYQFRLDQVLRVRQIQESQAEVALMAAHRQVALATEESKRRLDRYNQMKGPSGVLSASDYFAFHARQQAAAAAAVEADIARDISSHDAADRRQEWTEAASRASALERLDDRHRSEYAVEFEREAAREVDDIVVTRHGRHR